MAYFSFSDGRRWETNEYRGLIFMEVKDKIIAEIRKIYDPELPVNIYELGLIYEVQVDDKKA